MSISLETDLKEILTKLDNRLDKIDQRFEKLETQIDQRFEKLEIKIEQKFEKLENKVDNTTKEVNDLRVSVGKLEEKTEGLSKRIEQGEFINRGVLIGLIIAILGGAAKLFGFVGNP